MKYIAYVLVSVLLAIPIYRLKQAYNQTDVFLSTNQASLKALEAVEFQSGMIRAEKEKIATEQAILAQQAILAEAEARRLAEEKKKELFLTLSEKEQIAIEFYRSVGFTNEAIANLLGTIKAESKFVHDGKCGDGGKACGLFQWHPERRFDMPNTFKGQLAFSVMEMDRDTAGTSQILRTSHNTYEIRNALRKWIRWGVLGNRWIYADQYRHIVT